jgi:quercetin dioxygenase-like cupin family protein
VEGKNPPWERDALPDWLRSEGADSPSSLERELIHLAEALPLAAAEPGRRRLERAVASPPLRYAPFFGKLSQLWRMPTARVESALAGAADPKRWQLTLLRGLKTYEVALDDPARGRARLLRFAPHARFPQHQHAGTEQVLVLEGSFADDSGRCVRAGESQTMLPESRHELRILGDVPCVAAVLDTGIQFTGPWLRWFNRLLR